jgi:hypothetical protein
VQLAQEFLARRQLPAVLVTKSHGVATKFWHADVVQLKSELSATHSRPLRMNVAQ